MPARTALSWACRKGGLDAGRTRAGRGFKTRTGRSLSLLWSDLKGEGLLRPDAPVPA
jgi:hypothetical protein